MLMAKESKVFIPYAECGAADGGCFEQGRCLMKCQPRLTQADANAQLAAAMRLLKVFVTDQRLHGIGVKGSSLRNAVDEAEELIKRNTR